MATDLIGWLSWRKGTKKNRGFRGIALIKDTRVKTTAKVLVFSGRVCETFDNTFESHTEMKRKHQQ